MLNDEQLMEEAAKKFNISRLKRDMEKYEKITDAPWKEFLCILAGLSVEEAANKLIKSKTGIYNSLNRGGVRSALIRLLNLEDVKNIKYERISEKLLEAGYGVEKDHDQQKKIQHYH